MTEKSDLQKALVRKIGTSLSARRKGARLTQGELAERVGVDTETISRFERGATTPSLLTLQMLAVALNTTMAELIGESSPMPNDQAQTIAACLGDLNAEDREFLLGMIKQWCARLQEK